MTVHKLTAGDGYLYLTRQVAGGDVSRERGQSAADYYTGQGNPPGRWMGRGLAALGISGEVSEEQMRALFGHGLHPDAETRMAAYRREHITAEMSESQLRRVNEQALKEVRLGRPFPTYEPLDPFDQRVAERLERVREQTGREPNEAEVTKIQREESARSRAAVAGFDLVFTPVKSASVLWALDQRRWVRQAVKDAHDAARDRALALVEDHAALTRDSVGGVAQIDTHGLTMAVFDHWDSRLGDPNLHSHVAVSNKVKGEDDKWKSLDARALYRIAVAASEYYNTAFEHELSARLGVTFTARPDTIGQKEPVREIAGIDLAWIEHFARRRAAVEARYQQLAAAYRRTHGHDPNTATALQLAQQATLETRPGKKAPQSLADLHTDWTASFTAAFGTAALEQVAAAVPDRYAPVSADEIDIDALAARAVANVQEMRSTWTRWNVLAEIERLVRPLRFTDPDEHDRTVGQALAAALAAPHSLCVEAPDPLKEPPALRRGDGTSVFVEHRAARYTSHAILDAEARLLDAARTATTVGVDGPTIAVVLADHERSTGRALDPGQRALVTAFAGDGRLLLTGIGPAGSGKTTGMRAFADVVDAAGMRLIPLATSSTAAAVLGDELDVPAENLHKFLHEWNVGPHAAALAADGPLPPELEFFRVQAGDVVLVDEAGMAGTLNLDRLVALAAQRGAVVRLLGDHRQLGAVESGGALRLIATDVGAVELTTLYRFHDPAEADATLKLRVGDTSGLDFYFANDRVRCGSQQAMTEVAYTGWRTDMLAGKTTLMAAATNADVTALAARARADRVAAGQVEAAGVVLHDGNLAGRGDWIVTRDNHRRLRMHGHRDYVKNGDAWRVLERRADGSLQVEHLNHAARLVLPTPYVSRYVELLYANTTHRAQGGTVDTAHPLVTPEMGRENLYVIASRAREHTTLYVATHELASPDPDELVDRVRFDPRAFAAREILERILERETSPLSATETIRTAQADADSLATLVPRYLHAVDRATREHYTAPIGQVFTPELAEQVIADGAFPALLRALRAAEHHSFDPAATLRTVARQRTLADADTLAGLLAWRLHRHVEDHEPPAPTATPSSADAARYAHLLTIVVPALTERLDPDAALTPAGLLDHIDTSQRGGASSSDTAHRHLLADVLSPEQADRAAAEPAWPALSAALSRAADEGWNPAELLADLAARRELDTARQLSEVLAWRLHRHLATHTPPPDTTLPSTPADGHQPVAHPVWPRLTGVLKALETSGTDIEQALADAGHHTRAAHQAVTLEAITEHLQRLATRPQPPVQGLPGWIPSFIPEATADDPIWGPYLHTRAELITTRTHHLAQAVATDRPTWATHLGTIPDNPGAREQWLRHIGVIAAYRDQHRVRDNHPDRPLGPYIEQGRSGHRAYAHAAAALHALQRTAPQDADPARAQVAVDVYRALPEDDRRAIGTVMAARLPDTWSPDPDQWDDAATQPHHAATLAAVLAQHSYLTPDDATPTPSQRDEEAAREALRADLNAARDAVAADLLAMLPEITAQAERDHRERARRRTPPPATPARPDARPVVSPPIPPDPPQPTPRGPRP